MCKIDWKRTSSYLAMLCFSLIALNRSASAEDPAPATPFGVVAKHAVVPAAANVYDAIVKTENLLRQMLLELEGSKSPDSGRIVRLYVAYQQLTRWLAILECYREPALFDLKIRRNFYTQKVGVELDRFYPTAQGQSAQPKALQVLARSGANRGKVIENIKQMVEAGKPREAEAALEKLLNDVYSVTAVLTRENKKSTYESLVQVMATVRSAMVAERLAEANAIEAAESTKLAEMEKALLSELSAGSGSEKLRELLQSWKAVHLQQLRLFGFTHALGNITPQGDLGSREIVTSPTEYQSQATIYADSVKQAVIDYLNRDAQQVGASDAESLYFSHLETLADLVLRTGDEGWANKLQLALIELSKKSQMETKVTNYQRATQELLRWRQRAAKEWADAQQLKTAAEMAQELMTSSTGYIGLYPPNFSELPLMQKAAPDLVPDIEEKLLGKMVRTGGSFPLDGSSKIWMTHLQNGYYYRLSAPPVNTSVNEVLKQELLCNQEQKPLTIQAAVALLSVQRGNSVQVGGVWTTFALEGYAARLAKVPPAASNLLHLGDIGPANFGSSLPVALALRSELQPKWIQYPYYFTVLESQEASTPER